MTRTEALIQLAAGYAANPDLSAKGVDPIGEAESALNNIETFQRPNFDPEPTTAYEAAPERGNEGIEPSGYRIQVRNDKDALLIDADAAEIAAFHNIQHGERFAGSVRLYVFEDGEGD